METSVPGITREAIMRNRRAVKRSVEHNSFIQYLSGELLKIREFSRKNGIIRFHLFLFMHLDSRIANRFLQQVQQNLAEPLQRALSPVVENGWRVFEKLEYNKLVFIRDFARKIAAVEPGVFKQSPIKILEHMRGIEQAFLILYADAGMIASLERQLELYAKMNHQSKFPVDGIIRAIGMLMSTNTSRLTLYSFLIALNSLVARKYCDVPDLMDDGQRVYYSSDEFDVNEQGRMQLMSYGQEIIVSIKKHSKNHREISLFQDFIPRREVKNSSRNLSYIKQFYNTNSGEQDRFTSDWGNALLFGLNSIHKTKEEFFRFLAGEFRLKGGEAKGRIFDPTMFTNHFNRMNFLQEKLEKIIGKTPILERGRYIRIMSDGTVSISVAEEPIVSSLTELFNLYFQIARTLALILRYGSSSKNADKLPVLRPMAFGDVQFFIPYEQRVQYSSVFLAGQTVRQAMESIARVLLNICLELKEAELITILRKDIHIMETLGNLIKELKRISTARQFDELYDELGLGEIEQEME